MLEINHSRISSVLRYTLEKVMEIPRMTECKHTRGSLLGKIERIVRNPVARENVLDPITTSRNLILVCY